MGQQSTTTALLLIVCAVLAPLIALVTEPQWIKLALVGVQLVCVFLIGLNIRPPKDDHTNHNDTV